MQANLDPERIELMDRYLDKQLNGDELTAFELELEHDPEMFCELEDYRLFRDSLRAYTQPAQIIGSFGKRNPIFGKRTFAQSALFLFLGFLISFALIFSAILVRTNNSLLYSENYVSLNTSQLNSSGTLAVNFINGNYGEVVNTYQNSANMHPVDKLLVANAYLMLEQPAKAIDILEKIQLSNDKNVSSQLHSSAGYYLAMAYLLNNEEDRALPLFKQIHQDKHHPYQDRANNWFLLKLRLLAYF